MNENELDGDRCPAASLPDNELDDLITEVSAELKSKAAKRRLAERMRANGARN
jgi:hypothetical protein